jgi:hypothetical protein
MKRQMMGKSGYIVPELMTVGGLAGESASEARPLWNLIILIYGTPAFLQPC